MNVEIAQRLAELRRKKGYSQEALANALGLSRQAVSKWERAASKNKKEFVKSLLEKVVPSSIDISLINIGL